MRILITGGAGFIGSHVAEAYLAAGHDVGIVDDLSTGSRDNVPAEAHFSQADINDLPSIEKVFADFRPEVVSHHAAQMDVRRSLRERRFDAEVNILGSLSILELCIRSGVKKIIFASSGGAVYGQPKKLPVAETAAEAPISHYGVAKLTVERYLHLYKYLHGLSFTSLRYANVYGPRQNPQGEAGVVAIFAGQMLQGKTPTIFGDGSKTRDYVYIEDAVSANMLSLTRGDGCTCNIGCGVETSDYEIFDEIRRYLRLALEPRFAPPIRGEVEHIALDIGFAARVLNWKPKTCLRDGLAKSVDHVRGCVTA